ncbi:MAG TPA: hypothetical protein VGO48_02910 [Conexibacter sp.]|jgi:hypothetical protein|nr:hypothetical protein [Conexibacter sp.]
MARISFFDLYAGWTLLFVMVFGMIGLLKAPNDLVSITKAIGVGTGAAPFAAAFFAPPMYLIIHLAS